MDFKYLIYIELHCHGYFVKEHSKNTLSQEVRGKYTSTPIDCMLISRSEA